jgi:hypothetical protein
MYIYKASLCLVKCVLLLILLSSPSLLLYNYIYTKLQHDNSIIAIHHYLYLNLTLQTIYMRQTQSVQKEVHNKIKLFESKLNSNKRDVHVRIISQHCKT